MSKKRAKSGTGSAGVSRWESGLLATPFEEDEWKACVSWMVGNQLEDKEYISILKTSVQSGLRKLFTVITYEDLKEEILELGNPKGKKTKDVPAFSEICETAKSHIDSGEEIPLLLWAKLLKWKLLAIKQMDMKRREDEGKSADTKDKGEKKGGKKSARSKSAGKGKGKKSPEVPSPKKESKLKKRGEEDEENKFIDDEPDDGPQHYIFIEGFLQAPLLVLLCDFGINISSIIRVEAEDYSLFEKRRKQKEEEQEEEAFARPPEEIEMEKQKREKQVAELEQFWKQQVPLLFKSARGSPLQDVARLTYSVKSAIIPKEYDEVENKMEFGTVMFEDVACMVYDLLDSKRQYKNYIENMKLVKIPLVGEVVQGDLQLTMSMTASAAAGAGATQQPGGPQVSDVVSGEQQPSITADVDMRYYQDLMDHIPAESLSVPLIMHCMLEQVVATNEGKEPPSAKLSKPREDGLDHTLAAHIEGIAAKLNLSHSTMDNDVNGKIKDKSSLHAEKVPFFYHHGDRGLQRLHHLKSLDDFVPLEAERSMLELLPVAKVTKFPRPSAAIMKKRAARLHELLFHCTKDDMDQAEVDHAFKKFVLECLALRSTGDDGKLKMEQMSNESIVWDDPYVVVEKLPPEESKLEALAVSPSKRPESAGGILKQDSKSRQGSASSARSVKSAVHFEKDLSVQPLPTEKIQDSPLPTPPPLERKASVPDARPPQTPQIISVQDVAGVPLRCLDEWCFVEHLKPYVLLQVLEEARQLCPYIDTYYHKRDHSLLVVMHNPMGPKKSNFIAWDTKLHSDVGFRNYMEHVSDFIHDWTDKEEKIYQDEIRAKEIAAELAALQAAAAAVASPAGSRPGSSKARQRSQSPKKSRSKSPKGKRPTSGSPTPAANLDPNSSSFMRPNSMKAWKVEQDKLKEEEEKKKHEKDKKGRKSARSRSASPKSKKDDKDEKGKDKKDEKKEKRSASGRGSRKGDKEKKDAATAEGETAENVAEEPPKEPERYYPFVGYDVGNKLIQAKGSLTTMFPSDGAQICTERTDFLSGSVIVKNTILKDDHVLTVHILDPKDPDEGEKMPSTEKQENQGADAVININGLPETSNQEQQEAGKPADEEKPLSAFGSFTATLNDGMVLSLSNYGSKGSKNLKEEKQEEIVIPMPVLSPSPPPPATSPKGGRGGSGKKKKPGTIAPTESEKASQKQSEVQKEEETNAPTEPPAPPEPEIPPFQELFVSCPDGLQVNYTTETMSGIKPEDPSAPNKLLIKQYYPHKTSGSQATEAARQNPAMQEDCRLITSDGVVIKFLTDGSAQVLFPDGAVSSTPPGVSVSKMSSPTQSREPSPQRGGSAMSNAQASEAQSKKGAPKASSKMSVHPNVEALDEDQAADSIGVIREWVTTTTTGDKVATKVDGSITEAKPCMLYSAVDHVTKEVMTTREDRVVIVERPDGTRIVDHSDGTRITSYKVNVEYRETNGESAETGEMAPVKVRSVKQVKIECVGYATVIFNCDDTIATTIFGNGTQIVAIPDGSYEILHHDNTRLTVATDGAVKYTPCCMEQENGETLTPIVYNMHHKQVDICKITDHVGNEFTVTWKGEVGYNEALDKNVKLDQEQEGESKEGEAENKNVDEQEAKSAGTDTVPKKLQNSSHLPRFFFVNADGSGSELLRELDLRNYFHNVEVDPTTAILKDPLPDHPQIAGLTIMQPYLSNVSEAWLLQFDESNIIPENLNSRDFASFPAKESKTPGAQFGTNVGRGLAVGSKTKPPRVPPAPLCPEFLELRQLTQYASVSEAMRKALVSGLDAYTKEVTQQEMQRAERALKDPRSEEEKIQAGELLAEILAQDENMELAKESNDENSQENTKTPIQQNQTLPAKPEDVEDVDRAKKLYEQATAPPPLPAPPKPHNKYTDNDWAKVRSELKEEVENREALRDRIVPPYFDSQWGKSFLATMSADKLKTPDMETLGKALAEGNRQGNQPPSNSLPSTPGNTPINGQPANGSSSQLGENTDSPQGATSKLSTHLTPRDGEASPYIQNIMAGSSPSDVRPNNPTPGHAGGQGTPTALRPTNPTPGRAAQPQPLPHPENPMAVSSENITQATLPSETPSSYASFPNHPSTIPEQVEETPANNDSFRESNCFFQNSSSEEILPGVYPPDITYDEPRGQYPTLGITVTGDPRAGTVRLPAAIQGQKPGALPNERYQSLEEPARRKIFTSSLAKVSDQPLSSANRGFQLVPGKIYFGELREGCTYAIKVHLKNVGFDSCRYKIKQPPPGTGLQVVYAPGAVAAGMKAELNLELYAVAVGVVGESGRGSIDHHLEITTETDYLYLPVSADILTAHEYDELSRIQGKPYLAPGVKLLSTRAPSREGIIRPRRDEQQADVMTTTQPLVQ